MGARSEWEPAPLALPLPGRGPGPTAIELATSRPRIFSLSPRGTSGERVGERGNLLLTPNASRKQDGPPLPGPLLPQREERETRRNGSGGTVDAPIELDLLRLS